MPTAPPFSALFLLSEPASGRAFRGTVDQAVADAEPVVIRYAGGSGAHDVIWTDQGITCISDRVVRTLRVHAVTGWETFAVDVRTKAGRTLPGYGGLDVTGTCGPLDFSASERIEKITPSGRGQTFLGRYFDRGTWDGSMIFRPRGSADIVVTERVRDMFERAKVENIELRPLDVVEVPDEEVAAWRTQSATGPQ